jgi:hypothetical protein
MLVKLKPNKPLGTLTKAKLTKHLTDHLKASGVHPHVLKHLRASGFFGDLWSGIKSGFSNVVNFVKPLVKPAMNAIAGFQKGGPAGALMGAIGGAKPKKSKKPRSEKQLAHIEKMKKRGMQIKKLMKAQNMTLAQASKALKK